jgi:pimeloyl-ACP methyl ester carboxylesterase
MTLIISVVFSAAAILSLGYLYQWIGAYRDRARYTGNGRWVDIGGGGLLYVQEMGTGDATVLFEAGIAATNLNWCHVQRNVAQFARTASYDRGGLGWSSPCKSARTPTNIAGELHSMLARAEIKPPYVLVGHSFGGLVVRRFALMYPDEVAGLVLVDPMRCDEWPPLNPAKQALVDRGKRLSGYGIPIARVGLARLVVTSLLCGSGQVSRSLLGASGNNAKRLLGRVTEEVGKMPREVWPVVASHWSRPAYYAGMRSHVEAVPDSVREMLGAEPIREIPVLVLTPENSIPLSDECLHRIGNKVTQTIAPNSAHWIHLDQPDLVIESIRRMVEAASPETVSVLA